MKTINFKTLRIKTKVLFLLAFSVLGFVASAQKSVRIAYIDTEYILENVPEYQQATVQLDDKVKKWQAEI